MVVATGCPPRIRHVPPAKKSRGDEALDVAERAGLVADDHQREVILAGCQIDRDGKWSAFKVGINERRQNGKGAMLEIRELAGLFCWEDKLIIHSAHQVDTSLEHFERILTLIESVPEFDQQVKRVSHTNGREGVRLKDGSRLRFRARSTKGGRGFSCDTLVLDEAMFLPEQFHGALIPTLSARDNPQVWYAGSAVDQEVHEHGIVWTRLREQGIAGKGSLVYFEWSLDYGHPDDLPDEVAADPEQWAACNPAFGERISPEYLKDEQETLDSRSFAVERCGVGDYPRTDGTSDLVITAEQWHPLEDVNMVIVDPVCMSYDVSPERKSSISVGGKTEDGYWGVEVIEQRPGTHWIPERLAELVEKHQPLEVVADERAPSSSLYVAIVEAGVNVRMLNAQEHTQACGRLIDAVAEQTLRHPGGSVLWNAIRGAGTRPLGDAWAWSRRSSTVDISPLTSMTFALWSAQNLVTEDATEGVFVY